MIEPKRLYPEDIDRERYLRDLEAARPSISEYTILENQIKEMEAKLNAEAQELEELSTFQRIKVLKWHLLIGILGWIIASVLIYATAAGSGQPSTFGRLIGFIELGYIVYIIYMWKNAFKLYEKTEDYQEELAALQAKRQGLSEFMIKKQNAIKTLSSHLAYVPSRYFYPLAFSKMEEYMKYNGARNLAEAITMFDNFVQNK